MRLRFGEMLAILLGLKPHVLCLQEARWDPEQRVYSNEIATLREELDLPGFAFCETHFSPVHKHCVGHVILAHSKLSECRSLEIGKFFHIRRRLLVTEATDWRPKFTIATTHLSPVPWPAAANWHWEWLPRATETRRLVDTLGELPHPLILAADLNATPETIDYRRLREVLKEVGHGDVTHSSGRRLDYVFASPEVELSQVSVTLAHSPSDHYPVAAEIRVPAGRNF